MHIRGARSLGITFLLLVFTGCNGLKSCADKSVDYSLDTTNQALERVDNSSGTEEEKNQKPADADFVIEGEKVFYKGKLLPVLGTIEEWISVLGEKYRKTDFYVWDEAGLMVICMNGAVVQMHIFIGAYKENELQPEIKEMMPKKYYTKKIVIDGVAISNDMVFSKFHYDRKKETFETKITREGYDYYFSYRNSESLFVMLELASQKDTLVHVSMDWIQRKK